MVFFLLILDCIYRVTFILQNIRFSFISLLCKNVNCYNTIQYIINRFIFHSVHNMTYEEIYKEY